MSTLRGDDGLHDTGPVPDARNIAKQREIAALGAGHGNLLRAYFGLQAYVSLLGGGLLLLMWILGNSITVHGKPWLAIPAAAVNTWAALRARRLLGEGDPEGAWLAAAMLGCDFLAAIKTGHPGSGAFLNGIGLFLAFSAWRGMRASAYLDRAHVWSPWHTKEHAPRICD